MTISRPELSPILWRMIAISLMCMSLFPTSGAGTEIITSHIACWDVDNGQQTQKEELDAGFGGWPTVSCLGPLNIPAGTLISSSLDNKYLPHDDPSTAALNLISRELVLAREDRASGEQNGKIQLLISGLGLLGLLATIIYSARSTRSATLSAQTQLETNRPILIMEDIRLGFAKTMQPTGFTNVGLCWKAKNYGGTGCWLETLTVSSPSPVHEMTGPIKVITFIGPNGVFESAENDLYVSIPDSHETRVIEFLGHLTYRNSANLRWETGFALSIKLNGLTYIEPSKVQQHINWFDRRLTAH